MCALQAADTALNDLIARAYQDGGRLSAICAESVAYGTRLIAEAQADGSLRPDPTPDDVFVLFWLNAQLTRRTGGTEGGARDAWRRPVAFWLDGLRADAAGTPPVGPASVTAALPALLADNGA
ncbi:SbtR family transcriptional regulator [Embleya sp. NPDC055664]